MLHGIGILSLTIWVPIVAGLLVLAAVRPCFIVVGGAAATALGSTRLTLDLDVVYARSAQTVSSGN